MISLTFTPKQRDEIINRLISRLVEIKNEHETVSAKISHYDAGTDKEKSELQKQESLLLHELQIYMILLDFPTSEAKIVDS